MVELHCHFWLGVMPENSTLFQLDLQSLQPAGCNGQHGIAAGSRNSQTGRMCTMCEDMERCYRPYICTVPLLWVPHVSLVGTTGCARQHPAALAATL